ncbi:esterase E4 [Cephus cinctus]|uniref:Carboxylic ester hydrolase n=1 Tax=Cephus cinctus TaxID=211228 RepID=A0A1W6L1A2_CEPCN|nr:esterase E4 [Cephus cinctus]ARN17868.1 carboxylesterase 1 [Cephus cinctus]
MRREFFLTFLGVAIVAMAGNVKGDEDPEVTAPIGKIRGSHMTSRLGKKIYAFRGVRYAEPPVGQQRFQQAIAAKPWSDVFNASVEGPSCPQKYTQLVNEDCLRLNIYTTKLPPKVGTKGKPVKRPVVVFFHPGGFYGGSGQGYIFGPQYWLDQDIVLVTTNYRLASLGFLSTGDSLAPGNLGLKDQVEALRWIKKNIASFGGDPDSVTITGYSAGSWSVTLHMISPMSKGLFHRAIAMSGAATVQEPLPTQQKHLAKKQAELLGCPTDTTGNMLICLNTKTIEEFVDSYEKFFEWHRDPILVWSPVVEPEVNGVERFLPAQPVDLIRQGKINEVPLIIGVTKDEFGGVVTSIIEEARKGNTSTFDDLNQNWDTIAPISFLYERGTPRSRRISQELKKFYLNNQPVSLDNVDGLAQLYADAVIGFSAHRFVKLISAASAKPVYYYRFSYQGRFSHSVWSDTKKPYGVVHHDDLLYLFYISFFPYFNATDPEVVTVKRLTTMWTNFAKTGQPIPTNNEDFKNVKWPIYTDKTKEYLDIGDNLVTDCGLYRNRMSFWDNLFPLKPHNFDDTGVKQ